MKYYTESHEWIELNGNIGTVGITNHAQKELGEIVFIELPKLGSTIRIGEEVCVLESTKAAADVYAPVSGKIVAVNESLADHPSSINKTAETSSWFFKIELSKKEELDHLMSENQYRLLIQS